MRGIDEAPYREELDTYSKCMIILKHRFFAAEDILNDKTHYPFQVFKAEAFCLQFRLIVELVYVSGLVAQRTANFEGSTKANRAWRVSEIREMYGSALDKSFPWPFEKKADATDQTKLDFFERPVSEDDCFRWFNEMHALLHHQNLYRLTWEEREKSAESVLSSAGARLTNLWKLLVNHYRHVTDSRGDVFGILCELGNERTLVPWVGRISPHPST
ncbi:MAG: hypothetical protein EAZ30_05800 [Betaproteobacteria bacterium]|nr:MAG: hypothetical protein EAZ30_05800 [Betaproteobacteria bacterium]